YTNDTTDPGEFRDLHDLLTTDSSGQSRATAVIDATSAVPHLQIVANTNPATCAGCTSAFVLIDSNDSHVIDAGETTPLASLGGSTWAAAINDAGKVAGYSLPTGGSGFTVGDAVIWQVSNIGVTPVPITKDLGQFKRGTPGPVAINHAGWVAGTGNPPTAPVFQAWLWTGKGAIQDVDSMIPKNSGWISLE